MTYIAPTDYPVTVINGTRCDWHEHKKRTPPSREPGTDYATPMYTPLKAPGNGTVVDIQPSNVAGTGRYIGILMDNGQYIRLLHLSSLKAKLGKSVEQGEVVAYSGNSGNVGSHVHVTLLKSRWAAFKDSINFEDYLGSTAGEGSGSYVPDNGENTTTGDGTLNGIVYYTTSNDKKDGKGDNFALAGSGSGEAAWLIVNGDVANDLVANTLSKRAIWLSKKSFDAFAKKYLGN